MFALSPYVSLSYLVTVFHMHEGCDKVLGSAQKQPGIGRVTSARCGQKGMDGEEEREGQRAGWKETKKQAGIQLEQ